MELAGFIGVGEILRAGVYALVWRGRVIYIGKSKKMLVRIYSHRANKGKARNIFTSAKPFSFDDVFIRPCSLEVIDELERDLINLYRPKYNVALKAPVLIEKEITLSYGNFELVLNRKKPIDEPTYVKIERRI